MKKNKIYKVFIFILVNLTVFSNTKINNKSSEKKKNINEKKIEIIDDSQDDGLIYLDRIIEEEKEEEVKKTNRITKIINKIDNKVNPILKFHTPSLYGGWYLIKTTNKAEAEYENVKYNFNQEETGYRIIRTYYVPSSDMWMENDVKGWIKEKKGKVYLKTENRRFKSFSNEIIYFDKEYKYMIIKYESDGAIRVFSKFPINKIMITGEEKERLEKELEKIEDMRTLYNVSYNPDMKNPKEEMNRNKEEQEKRAEKIEKQLMENSDDFFKIN